MSSLDKDFIANLMKEEASKPPTARGSRAKKDPTEPRIAATWYKLNLSITDPCSNPDCCDPRPGQDKGRNITAVVHEHRMCRYCFFVGWLSTNG